METPPATTGLQAVQNGQHTGPPGHFSVCPATLPMLLQDIIVRVTSKSHRRTLCG